MAVHPQRCGDAVVRLSTVCLAEKVHLEERYKFDLFICIF